MLQTPGSRCRKFHSFILVIRRWAPLLQERKTVNWLVLVHLLLNPGICSRNKQVSIWFYLYLLFIHRRFSSDLTVHLSVFKCMYVSVWSMYQFWLHKIVLSRKCPFRVLLAFTSRHAHLLFTSILLSKSGAYILLSYLCFFSEGISCSLSLTNRTLPSCEYTARDGTSIMLTGLSILFTLSFNFT